MPLIDLDVCLNEAASYRSAKQLLLFRPVGVTYTNEACHLNCVILKTTSEMAEFLC